MGQIKESTGTHTVLTKFVLKSRHEIDLLRKIANFLKCTSRSSVPEAYRNQKKFLMDKVKGIVPQGFWVRVDARLGRGKEVDWAIKLKPNTPASRWERYGLGTVIYEDHDYEIPMTQLANQLTGRLNGSITK